MTVAIALVVIALFFALLTVERTSLYGVLKALGARSSSIFAGLVLQAVVVTLIAAVVAGTLVVVLDLVIPAGECAARRVGEPDHLQRRAAPRCRRARLRLLASSRAARRPRLRDRRRHMITFVLAARSSVRPTFTIGIEP